MGWLGEGRRRQDRAKTRYRDLGWKARGRMRQEGGGGDGGGEGGEGKERENFWRFAVSSSGPEE